MELSPAAAAGSLLHRVEPEYPQAARQEQVQGAVVLEVHIAADGTVQDVQVVSGAAQLAASVDQRGQAVAIQAADAEWTSGGNADHRDFELQTAAVGQRGLARARCRLCGILHSA